MYLLLSCLSLPVDCAATSELMVSEHGMAVEKGLKTQSRGYVCFSKTNTAEMNDIAFILDEFKTEEILYLLLVDFIRSAIEELLQSFDLGETGKRNPTLGGTILALKRLSINEHGEEIEIRSLF